MTEEEEYVLHEYPQGSFQQIFWEQQREAATRSGRGKQGMHWYPLMIRWCLYLRHQSNKAYETLRDSGCIHLPSQRTLHDYTNCIKTKSGSSADVDCQLMHAMDLGQCPEWHKFVIILIDEMHIQEGLVYDKHSGQMTGFVNLGKVNNLLLEFEHSGAQVTEVLATSMIVMMVRGLFTSVKFAYALFPCARVTGDLLFQPFWKAVCHFERIGVKVQ